MCVHALVSMLACMQTMQVVKTMQVVNLRLQNMDVYIGRPHVPSDKLNDLIEPRLAVGNLYSRIE